MMLTYPWPKNLIVTIDDANENARVTVVIPKKFPFRDRILTVVDESVSVALQLAWMHYIYTLGSCNHDFRPDPDGVAGAGRCDKCLSRFDNVMIDPATLSPSNSPLTVEDILYEIKVSKRKDPAAAPVYPTCDDPGNRKPHMAPNPVRCDCHGFAAFEPGTFWDAVNTVRELHEISAVEGLDVEGAEQWVARFDGILKRRDIELRARIAIFAARLNLKRAM